MWVSLAQPEDGRSRRIVSERASQRAFFGVSALLFAASAAVTIVWCASMSAMRERPQRPPWFSSPPCKSSCQLEYLDEAGIADYKAVARERRP